MKRYPEFEYPNTGQLKFPSESDFKVHVQKFLDELPVWHVKFLGCQFTKAGTPDILACIGGRFWGIELKNEKGSVELHESAR